MLNNILCSNCKIPITIDVEKFLKGRVYSCSNCEVKLGVDEKTDLKQEKLYLFKKFAKLKREKTTSIPCPDCRTPINFSPQDLKTGSKVTCSICKISVSFVG